MLIPNPGYDTTRHYHGSATMRQILHWPVARARIIRKTYMQVFIKEQSTRHYFKSRKTKGLECYVDADWDGSWQHRSSEDQLSSHPRTGYVMIYDGCPIIWASKMQYWFALSTTEDEYIALSTVLSEVIGIVNLLEELKGNGFNIHTNTPNILVANLKTTKDA